MAPGPKNGSPVSFKNLKTRSLFSFRFMVHLDLQKGLKLSNRIYAKGLLRKQYFTLALCSFSFSKCEECSYYGIFLKQATIFFMPHYMQVCKLLTPIMFQIV